VILKKDAPSLPDDLRWGNCHPGTAGMNETETKVLPAHPGANSPEGTWHRFSSSDLPHFVAASDHSVMPYEKG
jgi:hypothetical protein